MLVTPAPEQQRGQPRRTFTVRYFSPKAEVPFRGHATVATAVALAERIGLGELEFVTAAGIVPVVVNKDTDGTLTATLTSVEPHIEDVTESDLLEALHIFGWDHDEIDSAALPARVAYAGARHLVLAATTRERLADLAYDFDRLAAYMTTRDLPTVQPVARVRDHLPRPQPVPGRWRDRRPRHGSRGRRVRCLPTRAQPSRHHF